MLFLPSSKNSLNNINDNTIHGGCDVDINNDDKLNAFFDDNIILSNKYIQY